MSRLTKALFAGLCLWLTQCLNHEGAQQENLRKSVLSALAVDVTLTHYQDFKDASEDMASACSNLCDAPSEVSLIAARDAWWTARAPWKRSEIVYFGPVVEYPLRLGPKLDDWPVNANAVEELIGGDAPLDLEAFDTMGSATRGLPVVEYLLWSGKKEAETLGALTDNVRRCDALKGAAADVAQNATRLRDAWEQDWVPQLTAPKILSDGAYEDHDSVINEWVNRMTFTVENIRVIKLGKPAGDDSDGAVQPDVIESRLSERSLTDALDALQGVYDVWTGGLDQGTPGFRDLVQDPIVVEQFEDQFSIAWERLSLVPEPLEETLLVEPETIGWVQEALHALQTTLHDDIAEALDATIEFNDADGD